MQGDIARAFVLSLCVLVYWVRVMIMLFVFYRRSMYWREALIIVNTMPWCILYIAYSGGQTSGPVRLIEIVGVALFGIGSYFNTAGEWARNKWKLDPVNKGQIYRSGLFSHVRHINYTGDILLFFGFALIARAMPLLIIPIGMAVLFLFVLVPRKERYLQQKYRAQFDDYARKSKMLIPFIL